MESTNYSLRPSISYPHIEQAPWSHQGDGTLFISGGHTKIYLYRKEIDMRKSFEGLSQAIELEYPNQLLTRAFFAFINKKRDRMKILYWDSDELAIWYKRLERGTFLAKNSGEMDRRSFLMLLEGVTPKRLQKRWRVS